MTTDDERATDADTATGGGGAADVEFDLRDVEPAECHPPIFDAFDADGYEVERRGPREFLATLSRE